MFATTTAITETTGLVTNLGLVFAGIITVILGLWVALAGLGWGVRKVRQYISGRKF